MCTTMYVCVRRCTLINVTTCIVLRLHRSYDEALLSWGYPAPARVAETLMQCGANVNGTVVDLGCGTGMAATALRCQGFKGPITGVDISSESLAIAKDKPGLYSSLIQSNLDEGLPALQDNHYDAAMCVGVLSYVEDFGQFFTGATRVCKPGGLLCVTHRHELWDNDERGVRTAATALEEDGTMECVYMGEPEAYMPKNPDPVERAKLIRIICWRISS